MVDRLLPRCFAPKVEQLFGYGFAAGCEAEAIAPPACSVYSRAMPLVRAELQFNLGQGPHQGRSPAVRSTLAAAHSHRLTSGGEAEAAKTPDFWGKGPTQTF